MEIERKFLIKDEEALQTLLTQHTKSAKIIQTYISTSPTIRVRKITTQEGDNFTVDGKDNQSFILTIKGSGHLARKEFELPLTEQQYETLLLKKEENTKTIEKTRHYIPLQTTLTAEVDFFEGTLSPLKIVEVEFPTEQAAAAFTPPNWFGEEVTYDKNYSNSALSKKTNM